MIFDIGDKYVQKIENKPAFRELLDRNPDKIVVVKFFSNQCQACKKMAPRYRQFARDFTKESPLFEFAEIEHFTNRKLMKELGVKRMPSVHFYAGELGKVEDLPCGPKKVPILKEVLTRYAINGFAAANLMKNDKVVYTEILHDEVPSQSWSSVDEDLSHVENAIASSIKTVEDDLSHAENAIASSIKTVEDDLSHVEDAIASSLQRLLQLVNETKSPQAE